MGRHKGSQSDREVFLQLTLGRSTREGCWTRTVGNERSEFTIEPEGKPRATNEGEAEMKWLTALDDFRNWLQLAHHGSGVSQPDSPGFTRVSRVVAPAYRPTTKCIAASVKTCSFTL